MAFYNNHAESIGNAMYDAGSVPSGTIKVALMTTSYTFDKTDAFFSDLSGEASGSGYTSGGLAVSNVVVTQNDTDDRADVDFDDVTFSSVSVTNVNGYVLYYDTGTPSTSQLIYHTTFTEGAQSTVDGDFVVKPPSAGAFSINA